MSPAEAEAVHHDHGFVGWALFDGVVLLALTAAAAGYALALWVSRHRSPWPASRTVLWYLGLACAGAGLFGPVASAARSGFTGHMGAHLLLGMIAPLFLVLAAPVTLALRALPTAQARSLTGLLRSRPVSVVTSPVVAAVLNGAGLWALYTTDLYHLMHDSALVHAAVHTHLFLAGYLLTASLVGVDPDPHRAGLRVRSAVLLAFMAAHSILAKWLYAHPPTGVDTADAHTGAQLMYYGGDVVDITLIALLVAGWYTATAPRKALGTAPAPTR